MPQRPKPLLVHSSDLLDLSAEPSEVLYGRLLNLVDEVRDPGGRCSCAFTFSSRERGARKHSGVALGKSEEGIYIVGRVLVEYSPEDDDCGCLQCASHCVPEERVPIES